MIFVMLAATMMLAVAAKAAAPANPPAPVGPASRKPEMVCRTEQVLGSRLPVKKCRTAEQAAQEKQDARDQLDRAQGAMAANPL